MTQQSVPSGRKLLGWADLHDRGITVSKPTIYRWLKLGKFPKPVRLGGSPYWVESDIDAFIASLKEEANAQAA